MDEIIDVALWVVIAFCVFLFGWAVGSGKFSNPNAYKKALHCQGAVGNITLKPGHWRWESGSYTNGEVRIIVPGPTVCVEGE